MENEDADFQIIKKRQFRELTAQQKEILLDGKDERSTQRVTAGAMRQLTDYLTQKNLGVQSEHFYRPIFIQ